ncbi:hypothetical protein NLG97_g6795 [Lecanicillium saksenae]|uniref:Uncharacterized protein n=1 Tax=Lecanicillium saksenae TaxID=468837 RepID=A0ACC1QP70_9HYPO|nr:hypothetical protein NLG97_g6795 [Lecanicillium saksenae]
MVPIVSDEDGLLSPAVFAPILSVYWARMYPVWPVLDAAGFMSELEKVDKGSQKEKSYYSLATALSAATIAQLKLGDQNVATQQLSAAMMEQRCVKLRGMINYREHPNVENVLASFFLHVYHAKIDNRKAAMMYLQEAISFARLLGMHVPESQSPREVVIYTLLWVSERYQITFPLLEVLVFDRDLRGYAIQHGMATSIRETIQVQLDGTQNYDTHQQGLLELAALFAAFDSASIINEAEDSIHSSVGNGESWQLETTERLITTHERLSSQNRRTGNTDLVQHADFYITKSWMRILLWQHAMKYGLLSSRSSAEPMTFMFPSLIAKDLLQSFTIMSRDHLLPLGRDQVVKSFEVTNTLADVLLCSLAYNTSDRVGVWASFGICPPQFLHGLFQTIEPFLADDRTLDEMLRRKIGDAFSQHPARTLPKCITDQDAVILNTEGRNGKIAFARDQIVADGRYLR